MRLDYMENPLLEVVKYTNLVCVEEVGVREVAHDSVIISKHFESCAVMVRRDVGISYSGVGIAERSI
jgi:hypothetical protein